MQELNVIIVCDYAFTNGGAEKVAIESALGLAAKGINVIYFSAVGPIDERMLECENIEVICLGPSDLKGNSNKFKGFIQCIWNQEAKKQFDTLLKRFSNENTIIHAHLWQKGLSSSIFYNVIRKNYKIIFTMHHYFLSCPNGGFYDYQKNKICNCKALTTKCIFKHCDSRGYIFKIFRLIRMLVEKKIVKLQSSIKHFIVISDLGYQVSKDTLSLDAKFYPLNNPFNINREKKVDIAKNKYYIFVGRLSVEKGVIKLAEMSKLLNLEVVIVGDGPEREKMEEINPNLKFVGWVTPEEVKGYIKNSRAMIFPTLWYEGMPMSILECFSQGVPAIIPHTCAATQVVKHLETGFVYKQNDFESFKECISSAENNDLLTKISQNSFNYFWDSDYSLEKHCHKLISIYYDTLEGN